MLYPRNIRIQDNDKYTDGQLVWEKQQGVAIGTINNTDIQKQLEDHGIWIREETAITTPLINNAIETLKKNKPTVEAEWSVHFWQEFFLKRENGSLSRPSPLVKNIERRQLHSESYKDAKAKTHWADIINDPEDRLPQIIDRRHSVPASAVPWIMTKFDRRGYAYSDILYAATMPVDLTSADDIQRYPGIRLFPDTLHLAAGLTVEVKPLNPNGNIEKEKKDHAVRYSTLTASIMLHEELKLCYLASDDDDFFPANDHLNNHFVAAVGYTAYHFIHCLRRHRKDKDTDVIYESYLLGEYDLSDFSSRKNFRQTMNRIHVYQIEVVRKVELARLRSINTLDPETREYRLKTRIHKYIRFSHEKRGGVKGFKVHDDSPDNQKSELSATHHAVVEKTAPALDAENLDDQTQKTMRRERRLGSSTDRLKGPSEPVLPLRNRPRGPKTKPAHSHSTGPDIQPSSLPSYMKPTISNTSKAHLQKRTRDGRLRCQARLKERHAQCENACREDKMACGIPACGRPGHQASVEDQLAHTPRLPYSVSVSPVDPSRDSQ